MRRLRSKIITVLVLIFFSITLLPKIILRLFGKNPIIEFAQSLFGIGAIVITVSGLLIFALIINHIIIKRIKVINDATRQVASGNFTISLEERGNDEISALTKNFNAMTSELRSNLYLSKEFIKNVSHEIKTPLVSISGFAEIIEKETTSESIKESVRIIQKETNRIISMSKSMLQLSLIDSTTIIKKDERFKMSSQIRTIIANMQPEWEKKNIDFDLSLEEFYVTSNEQFLYQVWQNLISNAIKFSFECGKIQINLINQNGVATFIIKDEGIGISDENKASIFKQFFVADKSRSEKSTGLGLSICKAIIEKLGGTITFDSVEDKGTTFTVFLS